MGAKRTDPISMLRIAGWQFVSVSQENTPAVRID
jgi:hypothetical protein